MGELLVTSDQVAAAWPKFISLPPDEQTALIADTSQQIIDYCRRPGFIETFTTEVLDGRGLPRLWLSMRPIKTISAISVDGRALDNTGGDAWSVKPGTGQLIRGCHIPPGWGDLRFGYRWPAGTQNVVVDYWGGYAEVPRPVQRATIFALQWTYWRGVVSGLYSSESIGDYSYTLGQPMAAGSILPDHIAGLLAPYVQDDGPL